MRSLFTYSQRWVDPKWASAACRSLVALGWAMINIAILIGSTRPGRKAEAIAQWVHAHAAKRSDATFEVVDIADYDLPLLDEPFPPTMGKYTKPHTKAWAAKIATFDGFVFVTPEYHHGTSAAPK